MIGIDVSGSISLFKSVAKAREWTIVIIKDSSNHNKAMQFYILVINT